MSKFLKTIALLALAVCIACGAYTLGVRHAITSAHVWAEDDCFLINFDGEVYEYR